VPSEDKVTLAEELAKKHRCTCDHYVDCGCRPFHALAAINEAIERCAEAAENNIGPQQIAAEIRALKGDQIDH
jgi:hypothetical protein